MVKKVAICEETYSGERGLSLDDAFGDSRDEGVLNGLGLVHDLGADPSPIRKTYE